MRGSSPRSAGELTVGANAVNHFVAVVEIVITRSCCQMTSDSRPPSPLRSQSTATGRPPEGQRCARSQRPSTGGRAGRGSSPGASAWDLPPELWEFTRRPIPNRYPSRLMGAGGGEVTWASSGPLPMGSSSAGPRALSTASAIARCRCLERTRSCIGTGPLRGLCAGAWLRPGRTGTRRRALGQCFVERHKVHRTTVRAVHDTKRWGGAVARCLRGWVVDGSFNPRPPCGER